MVPEAMAAGLLVVTTLEVEAARFYIRDGENGVIIPPAQGALETQMLRCLSDRDWVRTLGDRARLAARQGDAGAIAKRMVDALATLGHGASL